MFKFCQPRSIGGNISSNDDKTDYIINWMNSSYDKPEERSDPRLSTRPRVRRKSSTRKATRQSNTEEKTCRKTRHLKKKKCKSGIPQAQTFQSDKSLQCSEFFRFEDNSSSYRSEGGNDIIREVRKKLNVLKAEEESFPSPHLPSYLMLNNDAYFLPSRKDVHKNDSKVTEQKLKTSIRKTETLCKKRQDKTKSSLFSVEVIPKGDLTNAGTRRRDSKITKIPSNGSYQTSVQEEECKPRNVCLKSGFTIYNESSQKSDGDLHLPLNGILSDSSVKSDNAAPSAKREPIDYSSLSSDEVSCTLNLGNGFPNFCGKEAGDFRCPSSPTVEVNKDELKPLRKYQTTDPTSDSLKGLFGPNSIDMCKLIEILRKNDIVWKKCGDEACADCKKYKGRKVSVSSLSEHSLIITVKDSNENAEFKKKSVRESLKCTESGSESTSSESITEYLSCMGVDRNKLPISKHSEPIYRTGGPKKGEMKPKFRSKMSHNFVTDRKLFKIF